MRAIMVMFDSLRRDWLPPYGGTANLPNFRRLAEKTVVFDQHYAGSLPCMPARRELHTGRLNFLHAPWCPLEPFDDSMPEILRQNGIHTHLCTDHYHYIQDGGATYHGRYSTFEIFRGQECDRWQGDCRPQELSPHMMGANRLPDDLKAIRIPGGFQNDRNRETQKSTADYPQSLTFEAGLSFMRRNACYDNWFLQIEAFDPHEPFDAPTEWQKKWLDPDCTELADWPPYAPVEESEEQVRHMREHYGALLSFCDANLGRVLDEMDRLDMWKDTMLLVHTDHGFLLGEHDWWGKNIMPDYNEICHIPLFLWDPTTGQHGTHYDKLTQSIDIAPTLLDFFQVPIPRDMQGHSLRSAMTSSKPLHDAVLFGYFNKTINITDGRYVYMRTKVRRDIPVYQYTLSCNPMDTRIPVEKLEKAQAALPFSFTKNCPVWKIPAAPPGRNEPVNGHCLYDLQSDPSQQHPLQDPVEEERLMLAMGRLMKENDAPAELFEAYGIKTP